MLAILLLLGTAHNFNGLICHNEKFNVTQSVGCCKDALRDTDQVETSSVIALCNAHLY